MGDEDVQDGLPRSRCALACVSGSVGSHLHRASQKDLRACEQNYFVLVLAERGCEQDARPHQNLRPTWLSKGTASECPGWTLCDVGVWLEQAGRTLRT